MVTTLGNRVHLSRRDLRMKQDELARLVGVSRTYISQIETGAVDAVMTDTLLKLAKATGVSVTYLLGLTDAPLTDDGAPIEAGQERIVFEIRDADLRAVIIELVSIVREMTPAERRYFVDVAQKLQRLMESNSENKAPIIIGS